MTLQGAPPAFPPAVESRIQGWRLGWAEFETVPADAPSLRCAFDDEVARLADAWRDRVLTDDSTVAEVRRLFRAVGCDPTRYRPSSEALLRRLQRDGVPSTGVPVVDVNHLLPMRPPLTLRAGVAGESMAAMRGLMGLADKPVLADRRGPFGTPISDAERVKVSPDSRAVWMVVYMPAQGADEVGLEAEIARLLTLMPAARLLAIA